MDTVHSIKARGRFHAGQYGRLLNIDLFRNHMLGFLRAVHRRYAFHVRIAMPRRLTIGLLVLCFLCTAFPSGPPYERVWAHAVELAEAESQVWSPAPQKVYDLLAELQRRDGKPLPGYVGGLDFKNRERRLPHGRYREYDVNRKIPGRSRGAERLVIEQNTGKAYYTSDHYRSFVPLN
jgi:guanyl-specific ribonuclease Sa